MEGPLEHLDFLVDSSTIFFCSNTSAGHWICLTSQKGDDSAGPGVLTMGNPSVMHHFDELPWGRYAVFGVVAVILVLVSWGPSMALSFQTFWVWT